MKSPCPVRLPNLRKEISGTISLSFTTRSDTDTGFLSSCVCWVNVCTCESFANCNLRCTDIRSGTISAANPGCPIGSAGGDSTGVVSPLGELIIVGGVVGKESCNCFTIAAVGDTKRDHSKLAGHQTGPQQIDKTPNGTTANWQDTKRDHSKLAGHQRVPQ